MSSGQVYRTFCDDPQGSESAPYGMVFRGIVYDDAGGEAWRGRVQPTPVDALKVMKDNSGTVTDLRPWSGALPAEPLWTDEDPAA